MRNDLGVAMSGKSVAARLEPGALFGEIEKFAVEYNGNASLLVSYRLTSVAEAHDAESP
jgi:hypothetical protein